MFTPYHAIMFAGLFEGGAGVVFQACNEEDSIGDTSTLNEPDVVDELLKNRSNKN